MSSIDERRERASAGVALTADTDGWYGDFARPRVYLQPIAAPSVLGLFGFAGATFIVAAHMAGWYGNASTESYLFPFAAMVGGLAQFLAGMWAYRARDALATAMHGTWGSFWLAYGILHVFLLTGHLETGGTLNSALGFWFIALAAITYSGALAALFEGNGGVTAVLGVLATGSLVAAIAFLGNSTTTEHWAGWLFVVAAGLAWYVATGMMLKAAAGREVLPLFTKGEATRAVELAWGEPGIKHGQ
jgi:succinate-acetate transporter protein